MQSDVVVVGAGLAGLSSALTLLEKGLKVTLIEKRSSVGGRVFTQVENDLIFDEGFQVILNSYPVFKEYFSSLDVVSFKKGALIYTGSEFVDFSLDFPLPLKALGAVTKLGRAQDILALGRLSLYASGVFGKVGSSTEDVLSRVGFSQEFKKNFIYPFFRGVLNSESTDVDANYFLFLWSRFLKGSAVVPRRGMHVLASTLLEKLEEFPGFRLVTGEKVTSISPTAVLGSATASYKSRHVIAAVDAWALPKIEGTRKDLPPQPEPTLLQTLYVEADDFPVKDPLLILNADKSIAVNHIAPIGALYGGSRFYISVNLLGKQLPWDQVSRDLQKMFGQKAKDWSELKSVTVKRPLPKAFLQGTLPVEKDGVFYAGDFMQTPSTNGAIESGHKAAKLIIDKMGL